MSATIFTYTYVIKCPVTWKVRYVGQSCNPKMRFNSHIVAANSKQGFGNHIYRWISLLKIYGLKPIFKTVAEKNIEHDLIMHYKETDFTYNSQCVKDKDVEVYVPVLPNHYYNLMLKIRNNSKKAKSINL